MKYPNYINKTRDRYFVLLILIFGLALILPTFFDNLQTPNLIAYFNPDEGYLMDIIWNYFSGEIRDSYAGATDYGLKMIYISDISRLLKRWVQFTPGSFVLILRFIHVVAWMGCILSLWHLINSHFSKKRFRFVPVLILVASPALDYYTNSSKPDYLVLLFMILGMHFILKLATRPTFKVLIGALTCASLATIIKFSGVFLIPAIVTALYFIRDKQTLFKPLRHAWVFICIGLGLLSLSCFLPIFLYVRDATGFTYAEEIGVLNSLIKFKQIFIVWFLSALFILSHILIFKLSSWKNFSNTLNSIYSITLPILVLFAVMSFLLGFRWVFIPQHFVSTYSQNIVMDFAGGYVLRDTATLFHFISNYGYQIFNRFLSGNLLIFIFIFIAFLFRKKYESNVEKILVVFLVPYLLAMFSPGRFTSYHMLPFFVVCSLLIMLTLCDFDTLARTQKPKFKWIERFLILLLACHLGYNGWGLVSKRFYQFHKGQDVAYIIQSWWKNNIPPNALVLSDHPTRLPVPDFHKNIKIFHGDLPLNELEKKIQTIVEKENPHYVYYAQKTQQTDSLDALNLEQILRQYKLKLLIEFDPKRYAFVKNENLIYRIYEILE